MLKLLKIAGQSLEPFFQDGDFVLVSKIPIYFGKIKPGDVIVFRHPEFGTLIKMVEKLGADRAEILVMGFQLESVDSRRFGPVLRKDVIGKVIWRVKKS